MYAYRSTGAGSGEADVCDRKRNETELIDMCISIVLGHFYTNFTQ